MNTLFTYTSLVTSEHQDKPDFLAMVAAVVQPLVDMQTVLQSIPGLYDVDVAVGSQQDTTALWVGANRQLSQPLVGVYFTWGPTGPGWGAGSWYVNGESTTYLVALPDDSFRILINATIAANTWDGTVPGAYAAWNTAFSLLGFTLLMQDNQDMTVTMLILGDTTSLILQALLVLGYLDLRSAGVRVTGYYQVSVPGAPAFGWGIENDEIAGWGTGAWIDLISY